MGGVLSNYTVMQQNEWAGRRFYTAQDRRTGQVVHLVAESVRGRSEPYGHASLPPLQLLAVEGDERWLIGALTEGDTLEDLRHRGGMTETDLVSGLLSIIDGLAALSALEPPPVPSYLDPACVKRDRLGRWTLDFLALAHAPEARSQASPPLGVYAFGVLLYWLATGQLVRRTRVQVDRIEEGLPAALQFIVIRCLGRNYPSLAELRADIERAGRDHEFRSMLPARKADLPLATRLPVIPPGGEAGADPPGQAGYQRVPLGGPHIPMNDRPWALPPRPEEGFRKYMVPPPPNARAVRTARWGIACVAGLICFVLVGIGAAKAGLVPDRLLPGAWRTGTSVAEKMPESANPGMKLGPELPEPLPPSQQQGPPVLAPAPEESEPPAQPQPAATPDPPQEQAADPPAQAPVQAPAPLPPKQAPPPKQPPAKAPAPPPQQPVATPAPAPTPAEEPTPAVPQPIPPASPPRKAPEPGTADYLDAKQGGLATLIHFNNRTVGWAYTFPHPTSPYISIGTLNRLFAKQVYWVPQEGQAIRLFNGDSLVVTTDFELVNDRLWIKLSPFLQEALGIQLEAYNERGMYFSTIP